MPDPITYLPIWRIDGPLVAAPPSNLVGISGSETGTLADSASVVAFPQAGIFTSQAEDLPGPYDRYRPYLYHRGAFLSPAAGSTGSGLVSATELAVAAETPTNVFLDNLAAETGTGADAASVTAQIAGAEAGAAADLATNALLAGPADAVAGADLGINLLLGSVAEIGDAVAGTDSGASISNPQPGSFASQSEEPGPYNRLRPYFRYDGPLLAGVPGGAPTTISSADTATAGDSVIAINVSAATEATTAADAVLQIFLGAIGEATNSTDAVNIVALSNSEAASGLDLVGQLGLGAAEATSALDAGSVVILAGGGATSLRYKVDSQEPVLAIPTAEEGTPVSSAEPVGAVSTQVRGS